ncbi:MAG: hypothetical protein ACPGC9_00350 [Cytophagales bacterium]
MEEIMISSGGEQYPGIEKHIPYLQVKSREYTGVGMYVNFVYQTKEGLHPLMRDKTLNKKALGRHLEVDGLPIR